MVVDQPFCQCIKLPSTVRQITVANSSAYCLESACTLAAVRCRDSVQIMKISVTKRLPNNANNASDGDGDAQMKPTFELSTEFPGHIFTKHTALHCELNPFRPCVGWYYF